MKPKRPKRSYKMQLEISICSDSDEMSDGARESGQDSGGNADSECSDGQQFLQTVKEKKKRYLKAKDRDKRLSHTIEFKLLCLDALKKGLSAKQVCNEFKIPSSTLSDWKRAETRLRALARSGRDIQKAQRDRGSNFPQLDECLLAWFANQRECHPTLNHQTDVILECARQ